MSEGASAMILGGACEREGPSQCTVHTVCQFDLFGMTRLSQVISFVIQISIKGRDEVCSDSEREGQKCIQHAADIQYTGVPAQ